MPHSVRMKIFALRNNRYLLQIESAQHRLWVIIAVVPVVSRSRDGLAPHPLLVNIRMYFTTRRGKPYAAFLREQAFPLS